MREKFIAGKIYHVLNRGVDKRKIFIEDKDYLRFIHDLFEFNDQNPINNTAYRFYQNKNNDLVSHYIGDKRKPRKLLVEILAFALMPNHYHLLVRPLIDDGVTKFMSKLNMGYAKYFNEQYDRSGALFEGRYKAISVNNEAHFIHLPYYIHLNPLDLMMPEWRGGKINNIKKAINFLENYRWSSYCDYIGKKNFPSVTQRDFLLEVFGGTPKGYKKDMIDWLRNLELETIQSFILE
jgi:putative transposase